MTSSTTTALVDVKFLFVGTGVSTAIPVIGHPRDEGEKVCVCLEAAADLSSPNRRNNVSLLLQVPSLGTNVLIDCGKTFRDSYFRTMFPRNVKSLDTVLYTHDHEDAVGGTDDLRDLQIGRWEKDGTFTVPAPMATYMAPPVRTKLTSSYGYILKASMSCGRASDPAASLPQQPVQLQRRYLVMGTFDLVDEHVERIFVHGLPRQLPVWSVPVIHGAGYISLGFAFGFHPKEEESSSAGQCFVYISDVSEVPEATMRFLQQELPIVDVLVVDLLLGPGEKHFSHFCLDQMWDFVLAVQPRRALAVGMYCNLEHKATNALLQGRLDALRAERAAKGEPPCRIESVELAFDGLELDLSLGTSTSVA